MCPVASTPATRRAADTVADDLRRASGAASALLYRPHPDGGYALYSSAGSPPDDFPARLWIDAPRWIPLGRQEHWLALPLGHAGRTGLALLGPFAEPALGRRQRRALKVQASRAAETLSQASVEDGRTREDRCRALHREGANVAGSLQSLCGTLASVRTLYEPESASARILDDCLARLRAIGNLDDGGSADRAARMSALIALADAHDAATPHMSGHSARVRRIAVATAQALGLAVPVRHDIAVAARLHDCGEALAVGGVLDVPAITDDQRERLHDHPCIGAALTAAAGLAPAVQRAIATHHERWDGRGYPDGLAGSAIPVEGRVLAVSEVFDALISPRPWRDALPLREALDTMYDGRGSQFDPDTLDAFFVAWAELSDDPEFRRA